MSEASLSSGKRPANVTNQVTAAEKERDLEKLLDQMIKKVVQPQKEEFLLFHFG